MDELVDRRTALTGVGFALIAASVGAPASLAAETMAAPPILLSAVLARAESAKHKRTIYENMSVPPSERLAVWPEHKKSDCSGFVGWCFGLPRKPRQIGADTKLGTNQIYDDATKAGRQKLFAQTLNPMVGDIILYPNYLSAPGTGDSGHVALLTVKNADGHFETIECASHPFHDKKINDAIAFNRGESVFTEHGQLMLDARKSYPALPLEMTRPPIFARYLGLVRRAG